jgi:hypothetical protein
MWIYFVLFIGLEKINLAVFLPSREQEAGEKIRGLKNHTAPPSWGCVIFQAEVSTS